MHWPSSAPDEQQQLIAALDDIFHPAPVEESSPEASAEIIQLPGTQSAVAEIEPEPVAAAPAPALPQLTGMN